MLLLPLTMTLVSIWFAAPHRWRSWWTNLIFIIAVALALLVLCSYLFNWTWTGFKGNTLWDWLSMLLVPTVLTAATIWFTAPEMRKRHARMKAARKQKAIGEIPAEVLAPALEEVEKA